MNFKKPTEFVAIVLASTEGVKKILIGLSRDPSLSSEKAVLINALRDTATSKRPKSGLFKIFMEISSIKNSTVYIKNLSGKLT
jgi:hypothetical protein